MQQHERPAVGWAERTCRKWTWAPSTVVTNWGDGVERLRDLGYPVDAAPGAAGGYRLGTEGSMPPLLLDDEEAVAVAISLHTATTGSVAGLEETALRALTKLQQTLPSRLRHRIRAFHATTVPLAGPAKPGRSGPADRYRGGLPGPAQAAPWLPEPGRRGRPSG